MSEPNPTKTAFPVPLRGDPDDRVICRHCSGELEAVAEFHGSVGMRGIRWFQWRHVETGKGTCAVTYDAEPYDDWEATRRIEKAEPTVAEVADLNADDMEGSRE